MYVNIEFVICLMKNYMWNYVCVVIISVHEHRAGAGQHCGAIERIITSYKESYPSVSTENEDPYLYW